MTSDVLLQWQDDNGAWQRGHAVEYHDETWGAQWLYDNTCEICNCNPEDITDPTKTYPLADMTLLVMPLYAKRPVAVWVEIGKLTVVPDRTD